MLQTTAPSTPSPTPAAPMWPGPALAAGARPIVAAAAAGVAAAALVPLGRPGLGWALAGLVVCAATAAGLWRGGTPARYQYRALGWGLVAVALLGVGAFRAAEWVFGICLVGAVAATVLAVTTGRTVRGLALGAVLVPAAFGRGFVWAHRGLLALRGSRQSGRLAPTVAVTALVLVVFGGLFASADAAYSQVLGRIVPDLGMGPLARSATLFIAGTGLVLAAVFLLLAPLTVDADRRVGNRVRLLEWAIPVGALVLLFASFVLVQLTMLFGGARYVLGPDGPNYAEYARGGFWQLLAVTALTLLVIGVAAWLAPRQTAMERWCLRALLAALAALTLVIVASALFRMHTYQEAYGFTRLRVLVSVAELWLGLVFGLVLVACVRLRARWLPRAVVGSAVVAMLVLAAVNPDRLIADRNLDRWEAGSRLDVAYLAGLSADAAPALVRLPEPDRQLATMRLRASLAGAPDDWRSANLSRTRARDLLAVASTE